MCVCVCVQMAKSLYFVHKRYGSGYTVSTQLVMQYQNSLFEHHIVQLWTRRNAQCFTSCYAQSTCEIYIHSYVNFLTACMCITVL